MRKIFGFILAFLLPVFIFGCEKTNDIRTVTMTSVSVAGSDEFGVRIALLKDDRVDEKNFDIQVRSDKQVQIEVWEENKQSAQIEFDDTKWKSLTSLVFQARDMAEQEDFYVYKDVQFLTYLFKGDDVTLTFRVVVGEKVENSKGTGYILANSKEVSDEFELKLKAKNV